MKQKFYGFFSWFLIKKRDYRFPNIQEAADRSI